MSGRQEILNSNHFQAGYCLSGYSGEKVTLGDATCPSITASEQLGQIWVIVMTPKRTRLISSDYVLDIVESLAPGETLYYYTVYSKSSGNILTLGHKNTWAEAEHEAIWSVKQLIGHDPGFVREMIA